MYLNFIRKEIAIRFFLLLTSLLLVYSFCYSQVKFTTSVSSTEIKPGSYIQVDYTIENAGSIEKFSPPDFKNFVLLQGPFQSSNIISINGSLSKSKTISYILQPTSAGKLTISGASAIVDGKQMQSAPVSVRVSKNASGSGNTNPPVNSFPFAPEPEEEARVEEVYRLAPGENVKDKMMRNLLVKLDVSKTSCYEGEPIIATYKLYSRLRSESKITKRPSFNGFSVYDMEDPGAQSMEVEKLDGTYYHVHLIRRSQLLPLQAGTYTLDPVELENNVEFFRVTESKEEQGSDSRMKRMMDRFFNIVDETGEKESHTITIKSSPVKIVVKPLPAEKKPESFTGAVGKFSISSSLTKDLVAAGDVGELVLRIEGEGDLPIINAPQLKLPAGIELFNPAVKEDIQKTVYPISGSKTFTYTFIPSAEGQFTIPGVEFSYFDPALASYKTVKSDSLILQVTKGKEPSQPAKKETDPNPVLASKFTDIITPGFLIGAGTLLLLIIVTVSLLVKKGPRKAESPSVNPPSSTQEKTVSTSEVEDDYFEKAREALSENKSTEFYSQINKAVRETIYKKTGLPSVAITRANLPSLLKEAGVGTEMITEIELIMKECELALYTPVHESKDMESLLSRAVKVSEAFA